MFTKQILAAMALVIAVGCTTADPPWSAEEVATQGGATLAASTQTPVDPTPQPLLGVVPPCTPAPGSEVDPCEPRHPIQLGMGGHGEGSPYPEPLTLRDQLQRGEPVRVTHVVMRGTYLPNTARCGYGDPYTPPEYSRDRLAGHLGLGKGLFKCYVDVRANEWLVGTGPSQVTVLVWNFTYEPREYTPLPDDPHGWVTEEDGLEAMRKRIEPAARLYENREQILFLGPPSTLVSQAWYLIHWWNIERQDDGMVLAFERWARDWERLEPETFATFRSRLVLTLPAFKTAIQQAHQLRLTQNGGRIGATTDLPDLVTDARNLDDFYEETGFTDATVPPPACGLAVPDPANDQDLMLDCFALLEGLDDLRGTGTLNWSVDTAIGSWDGVSTGGTPSRVTKLELTNTSLTGSIPAALARLNLTTLKLAGNSLTGCIPVGLKDVPTNDLSTLNLIYCSPPAPAAPTAGTATETSVPLTWAAVANTSAYRVEHRAASEYEWTVADDAITTTSHTVDALECGTAYAFRLSGYGSGTTYAAAWSEPSETVTASTGACTPPVFGATSYSFSVMGDTAVGAAVGTVTATDDSGEAVTYAITAGNDAGLVAIGEATGAITVAADLSGQSGTTVTLTVAARDQTGSEGTVTVAVAITGTCDSGTAVSNPTSNPGLVADCKTLLGLQSELAGTATLNWSAGLAMSDWRGISIGDTPRRVIGVKLQSSGLGGAHPGGPGRPRRT